MAVCECVLVSDCFYGSVNCILYGTSRYKQKSTYPTKSVEVNTSLKYSFVEAPMLVISRYLCRFVSMGVFDRNLTRVKVS